MAKYKDYPVYTYDEPATYSDFSGGINTDPSNEHLQPNEMRDCLNMHYSSAALVKRKGASLLCNIECEDELFNVQGVFLFTYRVTYIIIAADGKLYKGFYSPNSKIKLSKLSINIEVPESQELYNPIDTTIGLDTQVIENITQKHDGFIYSYVIDDTNNKIDMGKFFIGNYKDLDKSPIKDQDIIKYNNQYYKLQWITTDHEENTSERVIYRNLITPDTVSFTYKKDPNGDYVLKNNTYIKYSEEMGEVERYIQIPIKYWVTLDEYNTLYEKEIINKVDILSNNPNWTNGTNIGLTLDTTINKWVQKDFIGLWKEKSSPWLVSDASRYKDKIYICIKQHSNYINSPESTYASPDAKWVKLIEKKELIFQNHSNIEAATYNNKLYITTGTRFVVVEIISNELVANIVNPYICNTTELINIGYNYLSPYPELCRGVQYNQAITSIGGVLAIKNISGKYILTPQMNFAQGESEHDYYFKWEKKINNEWVTIYSYKDNTYKNYSYIFIKDADGPYAFIDGSYELYNDSMGVIQRYSKQITGYSLSKINLFTIEVDDADKYQYRVSFAKEFELPTKLADEWSYTKAYKIGDKVSVTLDPSGATETYICVKAHDPRKILWDNCNYQMTEEIPKGDKQGYYYKDYLTDQYGNYILTTTTPIFSTKTSTRTGKPLYEKLGDGNFKFICYDTSTIIVGNIYWEKEFTEEPILTSKGVKYDWIVDKVDGAYFGQGSSTLATELAPEDTFNIIHSCKKITSDGNKFLLYDDKYNSGSWYKTIINNPTYITHRGGLSFKTNKNESLIKVIPFNGTLIAFANAENVGGSIHMVTGNGDDWDDKSGYYSPYRRTTINVNVSCDNANTVQVCENILVFKYFDTLYYIAGSELNNEVVSVYSCNDKIKHNNNFVRIPWDDNSCISEVTEDYYALIWKEKYIIEDNDLILDRPALKIKMYYKLGTNQKEKIVYPWLRDESDCFNIEHIIYIKGKPIYLYKNALVSFSTNTYMDFNKTYKCLVHFRGEDLNYPKMTKLINNVLVYYHRNQYSTIDFDLLIKNEAGHILLDSSVKRPSIQDLRALRAGDKLIDSTMRLDSTILDSKVFNTAYKFPCLLIDTSIISNNEKEFSISSITYNYITTETPDQTMYDLYTNILRPREVK